jgi:hypothetical protein
MHVILTARLNPILRLAFLALAFVKFAALNSGRCAQTLDVDRIAEQIRTCSSRFLQA